MDCCIIYTLSYGPKWYTLYFIMQADLEVSTCPKYTGSLTSFSVNTVELVDYGHLETNQKCPDYQGVLIFQVSL